MIQIGELAKQCTVSPKNILLQANKANQKNDALKGPLEQSIISKFYFLMTKENKVYETQSMVMSWKKFVESKTQGLKTKIHYIIYLVARLNHKKENFFFGDEVVLKEHQLLSLSLPSYFPCSLFYLYLLLSVFFSVLIAQSVCVCVL